MFKKYRDLLPSYLNGENIGKHGAIIDAMDKELDDKIDLLRLWNVLERPILIEKNQTGNYNATINIHINTQSPIREIRVTGTRTQTIEYEEEELTTNTTITYQLGSADITFNLNELKLPSFNVTVTTYDDKVYTKAWPENDTIMGNSADHDEFLDIIGEILAIPRRKYSQCHLIGGGAINRLVPPYMAKEFNPASLRVSACTEDDYDYYVRLKQFITNFNETDILELMANVLYSTTAERVIFDEENWYPVGTGKPNIYLYLSQKGYTNFPVSNVEEQLQRYVPITREFISFLGSDFAIQNILGTYLMRYPNYCGVENLPVLFKGETPVSNATMDLLYYDFGFHAQGVTDTNGLVTITRGGIPARSTITCKLYGVDMPSYVNFSNQTYAAAFNNYLYMLLSAWSSRKYVGTCITDTTNASNPDSSTVDAGNGVLTWTPLVDFELVDTDSYKISISFHYTSNYQRVGFAKITDNTTTAEYTDGVMLNVADYLGSSDLNTTHTLVARFLNGIMYLYLDGDYTGRNYDYTDTTEGMLNFVAFNNRTSTGDNLLIGGGSVDATVDINTPPNPPTPAIPESLNIDYSTTWTGNGTRTIQSDGTLLITRPNNNNLLNIEIPPNDWLLTVDIEPTDNSCTLYIVNDTEGSTLFRYLISAKTSIIENDSSQTESKRTNLENFVDGSSVTRNTLYVKRTGNNITFSYKGIDNNDVTYTREYEDADGITGINFYKYANNNNFTVHNVKLLNQGTR